MASFDPLAALGLEAVAAAQQAIAQATIDLGVSAGVLQAQVSVGDVIPATILPPSGGNDLLSFLGQTVVASLPQGVYPGETLALQVTGFSGSQILVRNLGVADPANLPPPVALEPPAAGAPASAVLQTEGPSPQLQAPAVAGSPSERVPLRVLPQQAPEPPGPAAPSQPAAGPNPSPAVPTGSMAPSPAVFAAAALRAGPTPPQTPAAQLQTGLPIQPIQAEIEARIAAARATSAEIGGRIGTDPAAEATARAQTAPEPERPPMLPSRQTPSAAPAAPSQSVSPEQALLSRLRVPQTAITLAAARILAQGVREIPRAFAALERALAQAPAGDPRVPGLRALLSFTGRIDPSNTRTLAEQLASYVSNVLDGRESKFAAIVRAFTALEQPEQEPALGTQPNAPALVLPPATQAQVAERSAALALDVKTAIMSLLQAPPNGGAPNLPAALGSALNAITAAQLNVLNARQSDPNAMLLSVPVFFRDGGAPTQLRIARDARKGASLDGDSFHVAFVLDTKTLGTVAIDVQAVGREVSVSVKTERSGAAARFRSTLADLRSRLEHLRYRVSAIGADVAPVRATIEATAPAPVEPDEPPAAQLDLHA